MCLSFNKIKMMPLFIGLPHQLPAYSVSLSVKSETNKTELPWGNPFHLAGYELLSRTLFGSVQEPCFLMRSLRRRFVEQ